MRKEDDYHYNHYRKSTVLNTKKRTLKLINSSLGLNTAQVIAYRFMLQNDNFAHYELANNNF